MTENRRARLRQWFATRSVPTKEKSYLSQLMSGKAPFGEKAARRLENDYQMGSLYLDASDHGDFATALSEGESAFAYINAHRMTGLLPSSNINLELNNAQSSPLLINLSDHPDLISVPRVKFKLSAGVSGFAVESENGNGKPIFFRKDWFESNHYKPEKLFGVRVSGASMEPSIQRSIVNQITDPKKVAAELKKAQ